MEGTRGEGQNVWELKRRFRPIPPESRQAGGDRERGRRLSSNRDIGEWMFVKDPADRGCAVPR